METPLVLEADQAAQITVIMHKVMIEEQRGEFEITLPDSYLKLTPGDVVLFRGDRCRIDEVSLDNGEQKYKLIHDRKSAYQSQAFGVAPLGPTGPGAGLHLHSIYRHADSCQR
ncbi:phage tail protein [Microbulbifer sp. DLAB2-AF]|uniref:phage tail protein n=1 Tax=Microbulbifer sp. DLAB2-AF TaxID=3243395 RepID=UPI00403A7ACA